jgi:hypothetical protein
MLAVRRTYLVALILAGLIAVGFVVVPKIASANHAREARTALAAANASFAHLKVPADFVALKSNQDCMQYPCYRVPRPTTSVVADLPAILRSTGARTNLTLKEACPEFGPPGTPVSCSLIGVSHGYQVDVFLNQYASCSTTPCRESRTASIVEINPPYIPEDSEPWNGGSGWPVR